MAGISDGKSHLLTSPSTKSLKHRNSVSILFLLILQFLLDLTEFRSHGVTLSQEFLRLILHLTMKTEEFIEVFLHNGNQVRILSRFSFRKWCLSTILA